jgi:coenzyme PQQ precursor peptide PqqA
MPAFRPLPPRPSLEYERKEAKALLRRLRAGDPDARARACARHPAIDASAPEHIRLADAQLVVAREDGFTSWPRLVRWFGDVERQRHAHWQLHGGHGLYAATVRRLLAEHRARSAWAGRGLAAYVPRFYGLPVDDVFTSDVCEDDARLAVARMYGAPSWAVLLERLEATSRTRPGDWEASAYAVLRAHGTSISINTGISASGRTHDAIRRDLLRPVHGCRPVEPWPDPYPERDTMQWTKPEFEIVEVTMEVTAYVARR